MTNASAVVVDLVARPDVFWLVADEYEGGRAVAAEQESIRDRAHHPSGQGQLVLGTGPELLGGGA